MHFEITNTLSPEAQKYYETYYDKQIETLIKNCKKDIHYCLFHYFNECYIANPTDEYYITLNHIISKPHANQIKFDNESNKVLYQYGDDQRFYELPDMEVFQVYRVMFCIINKKSETNLNNVNTY